MLFELSSVVLLFSTFLVVISSLIFKRQLKDLKGQSYLEDFDTLMLKIASILSCTYRNTPSILLALTKLSPRRGLIGPSLRSAACKVSLGYDFEKLKSTTSLSNLHSYVFLKRKLMSDYLFQESLRNVRRKLLTSNIRSITTLIVSGITITPIPITLMALFYQQKMLFTLPIIASMFYGISLQLVAIILKRYVKILV